MTKSEQGHLRQLDKKDRQVAMAFVDKIRGRFDGQLVSVFLFGSRARGEAKPDSDMDLLVVMAVADPEVRKAINHLAVEVWLENGIFLSTLIWSQDHWQKVAQLQTLLYKSICRDGIDLLELYPPTA